MREKTQRVLRLVLSAGILFSVGNYSITTAQAPKNAPVQVVQALPTIDELKADQLQRRAEVQQKKLERENALVLASRSGFNSHEAPAPKPVEAPKPKPQPVAKSAGQVYNVTMYTAGYESTGKAPSDPTYGLTASGARIKPGDCACASNIPFGTKFEVEGVGIVTCTDRGGAIGTNRLDVYVPTLKQALAFGRQNLVVRRLN